MDSIVKKTPSQIISSRYFQEYLVSAIDDYGMEINVRGFFDRINRDSSKKDRFEFITNLLDLVEECGKYSIDEAIVELKAKYYLFNEPLQLKKLKVRLEEIRLMWYINMSANIHVYANHPEMNSSNVVDKFQRIPKNQYSLHYVPYSYKGKNRDSFVVARTSDRCVIYLIDPKEMKKIKKMGIFENLDPDNVGDLFDSGVELNRYKKKSIRVQMDKVFSENK